MQEDAYPKTKKMSVAGQFDTVKYRSGTDRAIILGPG
jgi:hypothetical protein